MLDLGDASAPEVAWDRAPATPKATDAIEVLIDRLVTSMNRKKAMRQADRARLSQAMGALALELYSAFRGDDSGRLRISRRKANYEVGRRSRYNASGVTYTNACRVADWLVAEGYAKTRLGYQQRYPEFGPNAASGQQSRIWATEKLVRFFEGEQGLTAADVGFAPWLETVVLREKSEGRYKRDIDYTDTSETRRMRANLAKINQSLAGYRVTLQGAEGELEDLPPFRLRRIFSQGSFEKGGRFYDGPWINLSQEDRARLLIDGEEAVELDYRSLHPRLIYKLEGLPFDENGDAYSVPGWEGSERRSYAKKAWNQLINSDGSHTLRKPRDIPMDAVGKGEWPRLIKALEQKHSRISHWFRSGRGLELQRIDSDIAERVVLEMLGKDVCCLPVHDSFIVPASAECLLGVAMEEVLEAVVSERRVLGRQSWQMTQ